MYEALIAVPILVSLLLRYMIPFTLNNFYFHTPEKINILIYVTIHIILGIVLWKAFELHNITMQIFIIILIVLTLMYYYWSEKSKQKSIFLLFFMLFISYCEYNSIFLSVLVDDKSTIYLNLISFYIVWVCFMITMTETNYKYFFHLNPKKLK